MENCLEEINNIEIMENDDIIELKEPFEVYNEIYNNAINKARELKKSAIEAYLEAKEIKSKYFFRGNEENEENEHSDLENLI